MESATMFFLVKLARCAGHPDKYLEEDLMFGLRNVGLVTPTGVWKNVLTDDEVNTKIENMGSYDEVQVRLRTTPPSFMEKEDLERLWNEAQKMLSNGLFKEIETTDLQVQPTYAFGVNQGAMVLKKILGADGEISEKMMHEKLRCCLDFRPLNEFSFAREKMRIPGTKELVEGIATCMYQACEPYPLVVLPGRKDVTAGIAKERSLLDTCADPFQSPEDLSKFVTDMAEEFKNVNSQISAAVSDPDKSAAYVPIISKKDFSGYYYQFAVRWLKYNQIGLWNPYAARWVYFSAVVCLFGNLHSAYRCISFSEVFMCVLQWLLVPVNIYIDDSLICSKPSLAASDDCTTSLLFCLINMGMSQHKDESHLVQKYLVALGLGYRRYIPVICVAPPQEKIDKALSIIQKIQDSIYERKIVRKEIEKLGGLLIFLLSCSRYRPGGQFVSYILFSASDGGWFAMLKDSVAQGMLDYSLNMVAVVLRNLSPLQLDSKTFSKLSVLSFTDASLSVHGVSYIGGVILLECVGLPNQYWSMRVDDRFPGNLPVTKLSIAIFEALAYYVHVLTFKNLMSRYLNFIKVDNTADVYALVNCKSSCPVCHVLLARSQLLFQEFEISENTSFIASRRNLADATTADNDDVGDQDRLRKLELLTRSNHFRGSRVNAAYDEINWDTIAGDLTAIRRLKVQKKKERRPAKRARRESQPRV